MARTRRRRAHIDSESEVDSPLDLNRIVGEALSLLDHVGLDGLSMRHLAERLGIQAGTIYWYILNKQALLSLLADAICGEVQPPDPLISWRTQLEMMMREYRRVLLAHRDAAHILAATKPVGEHRLRLVDLTLGAVMAAGFAGQVASRAGRLLVDYTTGFVQDEYIATARPPLVQAEQGARNANSLHLLAMADAPEHDYPNIALLGPYLLDHDSDARFEFGLRMILDGLEQQRGR